MMNTVLVELCRKSYILSNLFELPSIMRLVKVMFDFKRTAVKNQKKIYEFAERIGIGQVQEEIEWVADVISQYQPQNLVEIGTHRGGNAFYLSNFMPKGSNIITIDVAPRIVHEMDAHNYQRMKARKTTLGINIRKPGAPFSRGCTSLRKFLLKRFSNENCEIMPFYTYLNQTEDAQFLSVELLNGGEFDCIFYDADKSEYGVKSILKAYLPFLKQDGLLIIQDINYAIDSGNNGMVLYWRNLEENKFKKLGERISYSKGKGSGIGIAIKLT